VRIFRRKSTWQRLLEGLASGSKSLASGVQASPEGRSHRNRGCRRAHRGERGTLVLPSEDEHLRLRSLLAFGVGYVLGSRAGRERYEQLLAAAKRASARLDEYGPKLEQFTNQPPR
jgi:hypothetical protein